MEAARPQVDAYALDLFARRIFAAADFAETRKGACRILAPVTHILAETTRLWARAIGPVVEATCRILLHDKGASEAFPTLLTQAKKRRAARRSLNEQDAALPKQCLQPVASCPSCGGSLPSPDRAVCDDCLPERRKETAALLSKSAHAALAQLRSEGRDPMHRPDARRKVGAANAERVRENVEWERTHAKPDPDEYRREILPRLQNVPLTKLEQTTGLSKQYCSRIRRGLFVPHARHWEALRRIVASAM
jgi:hypothetical protein